MFASTGHDTWLLVGDFDAERGRYYPDQPSAVHSDDFDVVSLTNPDRNYDTANDDGGCGEYVGLLEHPSVVSPRFHRQEHRRRLDHRLPSQRPPPATQHERFLRETNSIACLVIHDNAETCADRRRITTDVADVGLTYQP